MKKDNLSLLIVISLLIVFLWGISPFIMSIIYEKLSDRASLGDSFGSFNSLFSGLAFAGIIYTIILQKRELSLQRQELTNTRIELERSATAQENSQKALNAQVENMRITSNLNTLNSLFITYSKLSELKTSGRLTPTDKEQYKAKAIKISKEIENLHNNKFDPNLI